MMMMMMMGTANEEFEKLVKELLINLYKFIFVVNAKNRTLGGWVRSINAAFELCSILFLAVHDNRSLFMCRRRR